MLALAASLLCIASTACAPVDRAGQLVIIGGALRSDNAAIYKRVFEHLGDEGLIGVFATASGVPEKAGPATAAALHSWASGRAVCLIDLTTQNAEFADTAACESHILRCDALWCTGGDQRRIVEAFRPQGRDTVGYRAVKTTLQKGRLIIGTSAGAAMMCDPMIYGGSSANALKQGASHVGQPKRGVVIGPGMGLFPYGTIDQHTLRRGRFARLIVAMRTAGVTLGFGVAENSAIHADLGTHCITAIGTDSLLLVDLALARHTDATWSDIRLSLLGNGDRVDGVSGYVVPASRRVRRNWPKGSALPTRPAPVKKDMFAADTLRAVLHDFEKASAPVCSIASHGFEFTFSIDDRSRCWVTAGDADNEPAVDVCLTDIRLDIVPVSSTPNGPSQR